MIHYIGIDNGVSGSIGAVDQDGKLLVFQHAPVFSSYEYTKKLAKITRIDTEKLFALLSGLIPERREEAEARVFIERPMVNPMRFIATKSALYALEATRIVLESERLRSCIQFVDSKEWQKSVLPQGCKGEELKVASRTVGMRLFPQAARAIEMHRDADGLLIAEWARREKR